jgi:transcriptional regulator with XRE-family HTH domain
MCAEINVQSNTYSQWESGARLLDVFAAIRMAERFGLTLDWLFRGDASALPHGIAIKVLMAEPDETPNPFKGTPRRQHEGLMLMDRGQVPLNPPGKKSPRGDKSSRVDGKPLRRR